MEAGIRWQRPYCMRRCPLQLKRQRPVARPRVAVYADPANRIPIRTDLSLVAPLIADKLDGRTTYRHRLNWNWIGVTDVHRGAPTGGLRPRDANHHPDSLRSDWQDGLPGARHVSVGSDLRVTVDVHELQRKLDPRTNSPHRREAIRPTLRLRTPETKRPPMHGHRPTHSKRVCPAPMSCGYRARATRYFARTRRMCCGK
jgi:hypothetical protein